MRASREGKRSSPIRETFGYDGSGSYGATCVEREGEGEERVRSEESERGMKGRDWSVPCPIETPA